MALRQSCPSERDWHKLQSSIQTEASETVQLLSADKGTTRINGIARVEVPWNSFNMPSFHLTETQEAWFSQAVERLVAIPEETSRHLFLEQNPLLRDRNVVVYLTSQVPKIVRADADRALQLARLAGWLSEILDDDYCRARSARAMGHPLQLKGKLRASLAEYQKALHQSSSSTAGPISITAISCRN